MRQPDRRQQSAVPIPHFTASAVGLRRWPGSGQPGGSVVRQYRRRAGGVIQRKYTHQLRQRRSLGLHGGRRCCGLLHQRGILLSHLVHLADGVVDLLDAGRLLAAGEADFATISATFRTLSTTRSMVAPACSTSTLRSPTFFTESSMSSLISLTAVALRCARLRTSLATTANPRPCSPARAASTAAFKARILVWKAMPSITLMMSTILREEPLMAVIVATTRPTTSPPSTAMPDAAEASWLAV